jgi:hypothetical protein
MITTTQRAMYQWAWYGAIIGLLIPLTDIVFAWRDVSFAPWIGQGIFYNLGQIAGSVCGGAIIGLFGGAIKDGLSSHRGRPK